MAIENQGLSVDDSGFFSNLFETVGDFVTTTAENAALAGQQRINDLLNISGDVTARNSADIERFLAETEARAERERRLGRDPDLAAAAQRDREAQAAGGFFTSPMGIGSLLLLLLLIFLASR